MRPSNNDLLNDLLQAIEKAQEKADKLAERKHSEKVEDLLMEIGSSLNLAEGQGRDLANHF